MRVREWTGLIGCGGTRAGGRAVRVLGVLATLGLSLALTPAALASTNFTWTGQSTVTEEWSAPANWVGDVEPTTGEAIGTLAFPRLTNEVCEENLGTEPCYISSNNVSGLSAESVQIDDGDDYLIGGDEIAIGSGGLTASPAAVTSELTVAELDLPVALGASQTWNIGGEGAGHRFENDLYLGGELTGSGSALTIDMSDGPGLYLGNDTEVGPVAIDGANTSEPGILNGAVELFGGDLNSTDKNPVSLNHIFLDGAGAVGPLTTDAAEVAVGSGEYPAEGIEATSVKLDPASHVDFEISGTGEIAQKDYSQLSAHGTVELAGSKIEVVVRPPKEGKPCPTLTPGQTYTFISTAGTLLGSFSNATKPEEEIPLRFADACTQKSQTIQISYHETGGTETVTGTVEEAAATKKQEEEAAARKKHEEEEAASKKKHEEEVKSEEGIRKLVEEHAKKVGEEAAGTEAIAREAASKKQQEEAAAAAAKKHQEEEAVINHKHEEEAAAKKKEEEENATTGSVSLNGPSIIVQSSGEAAVKLSCAGTTTCAGKLTLTVKSATRKGEKAKTETIGTAAFSIPPNETTTIKLTLNAAGKALLGSDHGHLDATLSILKSSPAPSQTHTDGVHLVQQKAHGKTKK